MRSFYRNLKTMGIRVTFITGGKDVKNFLPRHKYYTDEDLILGEVENSHLKGIRVEEFSVLTPYAVRIFEKIYKYHGVRSIVMESNRSFYVYTVPKAITASKSIFYEVKSIIEGTDTSDVLFKENKRLMLQFSPIDICVATFYPPANGVAIYSQHLLASVSSHSRLSSKNPDSKKVSIGIEGLYGCIQEADPNIKCLTIGARGIRFGYKDDKLPTKEQMEKIVSCFAGLIIRNLNR